MVLWSVVMCQPDAAGLLGQGATGGRTTRPSPARLCLHSASVPSLRARANVIAVFHLGLYELKSWSGGSAAISSDSPTDVSSKFKMLRLVMFILSRCNNR